MIRLLYNYYEDKNSNRKKEIDLCYKNNLQNDLLTVVILDIKEKPTYNYLFNEINKLTTDNDINIICNSDIFFDTTIALAEKIQHNEMWALSRWEWKPDIEATFFNRPDSQDTWITRGKIKNVNGNFTLGKRGCDNRIAYEFQVAGYKILNPSKTIKTYHVHNSGIRYYNHEAVPPPYLTIHPTELL